MCITIYKSKSHLYATWKVGATLSSVTTRLISGIIFVSIMASGAGKARIPGPIRDFQRLLT